MVYRRKRAIAAEVLREFRDGRISNDEYERRWPKNKGNRVFGEVFGQIWLFGEDISTLRLMEEYELPPVIRALFVRCILFLESEQEYDWPAAKLGDARFLFDVPIASSQGCTGIWSFLLCTGFLLLLSVWYEKALCLTPVIIGLWFLCGLVYLVHRMVGWLREDSRPEPEVRKEIKFQAEKEYWPFHGEEELQKAQKKAENASNVQ